MMLKNHLRGVTVKRGMFELHLNKVRNCEDFF